MQPGLEQPELMVQALAAHNTLTDCLMQGDESEDLMDKILEDVSSFICLDFDLSFGCVFLFWEH